MDNFFFQPDNAWVGDLIPYCENDQFFAFYLHDPRKRKDRYAENTCWHLVTTKDFQNVEYHGTAIPCGGSDRPNENAYTGSVIRDHKGIYHAFFTAFNPKLNLVEGKPTQAVMKATGQDLQHLKVDESFFFVADNEIYEVYDWRDPFVYWDDEKERYCMLLCARRKGMGALRGGCLALCSSDDLNQWSYEEPFYEPHQFVTMECPDYFRWGNWYYLVFSTFNERFTTHYRVSASPNGPWIIPENDTFDTRANYAIKTAGDERRYLFGWIPTKRDSSDFGSWEWGGTMVFHELVQDQRNGNLWVKSTGSEEKYFCQPEPLQNRTTFYAEVEDQGQNITLTADNLGAVLYDVPKEPFRMDVEIIPETGYEFGIVLHSDENLEKGYFLRMHPGKNAAWDMWPRVAEQGVYQWQIKGDIPYQVDTERPLPKAERYRITLVKEKDICVVYVNDQIALSYRMYNHKDGKFGIYLLQGKASIKGLSVHTR